MKAMLIVSVLFAMACSGSSDSSSTNLTYDLTENGCPTHAHSFSSVASECLCLQDDTFNNNCAADLRQQQFQQLGCPGTFGAATCQ